MPSERDKASGNPYKSPLPESRPKGAVRITATIGLAYSLVPFAISILLFYSFATRRFKDGVTFRFEPGTLLGSIMFAVVGCWMIVRWWRSRFYEATDPNETL